MAKKEKVFLVSDPAFAQYVYYKMVNCPPLVRGRLNPAEQRYFRSKDAMRKFATDETFERRILLLTRMGVRWSVVMYEETADLDLMYKEVDENYTFTRKNLDLMNLMRKGDVFCFGSSTIMMAQLLAEQGCHSQKYVLDYGYLRTLKKMPDQRAITFDVKANDMEQQYMHLARIIYQSITCWERLELTISDDGVTALAMRILIVLLGHRHSFVTARSMKHRLGVPISNQITVRTMNQMVKNGLIYQTRVPELEFEQKAYTISEKGLEKVMYFLKYVQQQLYEMN